MIQLNAVTTVNSSDEGRQQGASVERAMFLHSIPLLLQCGISSLVMVPKSNFGGFTPLDLRGLQIVTDYPIRENNI